MPLVSSGSISIGGTTTNRSINLELSRSATATSSLNETALRNLAGVSSGTISLSNFYGKSADNFEGFVTNGSYGFSSSTISITAPTGSNAFIGVAQDSRSTGSQYDISLSGSPTLIQPNNLAQDPPENYDRSQGFFKLNPGTTSIGYYGNYHTIAGAGFSGVTSLAQNVSSATSSLNTVSVTRTTATNRTFIGLAASHASSDNDSTVNFSGYTAFGRIGNSEDLRGGSGVAYRQGTGVSQTYTHAYGGTDEARSEYAFHELVT